MGNLNIDFKDKKNIYCIVMIAVILLGIYAGYTYMWDPFQKEYENLESQRISAQKELDKINSKKHRVAELEMQLAQAEKDFQKLKEMFPEEEKVPLRLQDLYSVLRSSGVQIQKFNPEVQSRRTFRKGTLHREPLFHCSQFRLPHAWLPVCRNCKLQLPDCDYELETFSLFRHCCRSAEG